MSVSSLPFKIMKSRLLYCHGCVMITLILIDKFGFGIKVVMEILVGLVVFVTGGSGRLLLFCNRPEPAVLGGQPPVEF